MYCIYIDEVELYRQSTSRVVVDKVIVDKVIVVVVVVEVYRQSNSGQK